MKEKFVYYYMGIAKSTADLSSARKKRVGCIIVKDNRVISMGYNGMPSGWDNECENWIPHVPFYVHPDDREIYGTFETKPEVLHAETNAISKLARSTESGEGADLFVTCTPCIECAKLIHQAGIARVFYDEDYDSSKGNGLAFLNRCGIYVEKVEYAPKNQVQTLEDQ